MKKAILATKLGMTQVFGENGELIPVTVLEAGPCVVTQVKTVENDGYEAVQVGFGDAKVKATNKDAAGSKKVYHRHGVNKPEKGHFDKAGVAPKKYVREFRFENSAEYELAQEIKADIFEAGDVVDVTGISKGHGYSGTIARYNAHRGPESHGGSKNTRHIGSLATTGRNNGRIEKNTPMPGQDGGYRTTNQNLTVIKTNAEEGYILVKGNVPGPRRGLVEIKTTVKPVKKVAVEELVSYAAEAEAE